MHKLPKYFYSSFERIQNLKEYFGDALDLRNNHELLTLAKRIVIITPHDRKYYSTMWQKDPHYNRTIVLELNKFLDELQCFAMRQQNFLHVLFVSRSLSLTGECTNTAMNEFKTNKAWAQLLEQVGPRAFGKLILDHIVITRLSGGGYFQISGYPISSLPKPKIKKKKFKRKKAPEESKDEMIAHPSKRPRLSRRHKKKLKIAEQKQEEKHTAKQPISDELFINRRSIRCILSEIKDIDGELMTQPSDNDRELKEKIVGFLKHIFPEEFSTKNRKRRFLQKYQSIHQIATSIYKRHHRNKPRHLFNLICPRKEFDGDIMDMVLPHGKVILFIKTQLKNVFPLEFWGSQHNFDVICRAVKCYVSRNMYEKLSLSEVLHQFKTKDCKWLYTKSTEKMPLSASQKGHTLLTQALRWVFHGYIAVLIRQLMYVTPFSGEQIKLFYFRKDIWCKISDQFLKKVVNQEFYKPVDTHTLHTIKLGISRTRLVPKKNGFRLIANMKRTITFTQTNRLEQGSINKKLSPALPIFKFEQQQPGLSGSAVTTAQLFERLREYKQKMRERMQRGLVQEKLYFVKIDIANCYDTLDQDLLVKILENVLDSKEYIHKYLELWRGFSLKSMRRVVGTPDKIKAIDFCSREIRSSSRKKDFIIVDMNQGYTKRGSEILRLVKESIKNDVLKIGGKYYRRQRGISQGSCLSNALCNFFFGEFEKHKLGFFKKNRDDLLFRFVDDFIYITPSKEHAQQFYQTMVTGLADYGITVNEEKCLSNFENDMDEFPWLGYLFNTRNLNVHLDLANAAYLDLVSTVTVDYVGNIEKTLLNSQVRNIKIKMNNMLIHTDLNTIRSISRNFKDIFYLSARRLEIQTSKLYKSPRRFFNPQLILNTIIKTANVVEKSIPKTLKKEKVMINYFVIYWMVFRKKQMYKEICDGLEWEIRGRRLVE
ncbi:hypothetical protein RMATCC62417_08512 [Rhizopus microsporus]|nr:hypothetical protein RMATCC62417_08512 [Rhizopus microsporus]